MGIVGRRECGCLDDEVAYQLGIHAHETHPQHRRRRIQQALGREWSRRESERAVGGTEPYSAVAQADGTLREGQGIARGGGVGEKESRGHPP